MTPGFTLGGSKQLLEPGRWWQLELEVDPSSQPRHPLGNPPKQRQSYDGYPQLTSDLTGSLGMEGVGVPDV